MERHVRRWAFLFVALAAGLTAWFMRPSSPVSEAAGQLQVLCGAGLLKPIEEVSELFKSKYGTEVIVRYGGASELLGQLALGQPCDVFIPGARKYVMEALERGWVEKGSVRDIVLHVPVIAVAAGNPLQIGSLADLARPGMRVALGDPEACAIGALSVELLKKNGLHERVSGNVRVTSPTVNQLLLYVAMGESDASIIWEDMARWAEAAGKLETVPIKPENNLVKTISSAIGKRSARPGAAREFNAMLVSDQGLEIFAKWGFSSCPR